MAQSILITADWNSEPADIVGNLQALRHRINKDDGWPKPQERSAIVSHSRMQWLRDQHFVDDCGRVTPKWFSYLDGIMDRHGDEWPASVLGVYEVERFVCFDVPDGVV